MRRWIPCLATLLLALAACGEATPRSGQAPVLTKPVCPQGGVTPDPAPPTVPSQTGHWFGRDEPSRSQVPDGFKTAWVLRCRDEVRDRPGEGKWLVTLAERADTPAPELVAELRRSSDPRTTEACTQEPVQQPYFMLVDAGDNAVLAAVPTDGCAKPRRQALAELEKLSFRTVAEQPVKQVAKAIETACPDTWKDPITSPTTVELKAVELSFPWGPLKVCVYDRAGAEVPVGKLSKDHTIPADAAKALGAELKKLGPARVCSDQHTRFAVLISDTPPGVPAHWGNFELDGCRRLIVPDVLVFRQLDERTIAMLAG